MKLGPHTLTPLAPGLPVLTLAPLAGVGNWVFRSICARLGARMVGAEFVNCRDLADPSSRAARAVDFSDAELYAASGISVLAAQIYGNDIDLIAAGARELERRGAQVVDLNFGCSVPRIVQKGSGAAYLRDLDLLYRAVRATAEAVCVPVTVKTRIGWDEDSINLLEMVRGAQDAGAQAIGIHARTVQQPYRSPASWEWIARAKEVATVPILGNGDVFSIDDAVAMQEQTGCDAVMIGRAAMANPWIFSGRRGASLAARVDLAAEQLRQMAAFKGERTGVRETRKHLALYFKGLPRASEMRRRLLTTDTLAGLTDLLCRWREALGLDPAEEDLTLSPAEATALAWGGNG